MEENRFSRINLKTVNKIKTRLYSWEGSMPAKSVARFLIGEKRPSTNVALVQTRLFDSQLIMRAYETKLDSNTSQNQNC